MNYRLRTSSFTDSSSGGPRHLGADHFDYRQERYKIVVLFSLSLVGSVTFTINELHYLYNYFGHFQNGEISIRNYNLHLYVTLKLYVICTPHVPYKYGENRDLHYKGDFLSFAVCSVLVVALCGAFYVLPCPLYYYCVLSSFIFLWILSGIVTTLCGAVTLHFFSLWHEYHLSLFVCISSWCIW